MARAGRWVFFPVYDVNSEKGAAASSAAEQPGDSTREQMAEQVSLSSHLAVPFSPPASHSLTKFFSWYKDTKSFLFTPANNYPCSLQSKKKKGSKI